MNNPHLSFVGRLLLLSVAILSLLLSSCASDVVSDFNIDVETVSVPQLTIQKLDTSIYNNKVEVCFDGDTAIVHSELRGVAAEAKGADVVLRSEMPGVEFVVKGSTSNGSLTVVSSRSPLVTLDNLSLVACGKNAVQVSSEEVIFLRASGNNSVVDLSDGVKADNQSTAIKLMGEAVICEGTFSVKSERRSAVFCTGTLYIDGASLSLEGAPNNALLANNSVVMAAGMLSAVSAKDVVKCKNGDFVMLGGCVSLSSENDKADGVQAVSFYQTGGDMNILVAGAAADGIKTAANLCIKGGNVNVVTRGDALFNAKKSDYSSSSCIKSDILVEIDGGNCSFRSEGEGAKGISSDSLIVVTGGNIRVVTKGGGVNDPIDINAHASSKGIKSDASICFVGGNIEVLVFGEEERSEGVEAKGDMHFGGDCTLYVYAYDDAINVTDLFVADGRIYAYSVANDAIDSNGRIEMNGGVVIADAPFSPEQGVDVDDFSLFTVNGGTLFSVGGSMGPSPALPMGENSCVPAIAWSGARFDKDLYLSIVGDDGVALYSYRLQRVVDNAACLVVSPLLDKGGLYSFVLSGSIDGGKLVGNGLYAGVRPADVLSSVSFKPEGLVSVVDMDGNVMKGMRVGMPFSPRGPFPPDSVMKNGAKGFPPGGHSFDGQGFPPSGFPPFDAAEMPEGFGFPTEGSFLPPPPVRKVKSEYSEGNLPGYGNI